MAPYLTGKYGLEIGGPSGIFCSGHLIPVYSLCRGIDTCNFSAQTIWSEPTNLLKFGPRPGKQFVAEASDLSMVPDETYDFVLASHVLEHIANPLRALQEWKRVLNPEELSWLLCRINAKPSITDAPSLPSITLRLIS